MEVESIIQHMRDLLRKEEEAQEKRFLEGDISLKELRSEGAVIHPIRIQNKNFGYNDQPVISVHFTVPGGVNFSFYSQGTPVALFLASTNEICNGQLLDISDKGAEILLFSEDFPDWIDDKNIGIKRLPDDKTFKLMHAVLKSIAKAENKLTRTLFEMIHGVQATAASIIGETTPLEMDNSLNEFQQKAVIKGLENKPLHIIHGPPGTGKTTTIAALISELRKQGKSIIASAPSNAAIDHLAQQLIEKGLKVLRLGNTARVNEAIWTHTPEGILSQEKYSKQLKKLRIRAEEYRKMARQYKRSFGKEERAQRKLLFQEVHAIRAEIRLLTDYYLEQYFDDADVVLGTPVGLNDSLLKDKVFDVAFLDEAGQCIEPLAWLVANKAKRLVLSGDHFQLPPTIVSHEKEVQALAVSILESAIQNKMSSERLEIQYRMTPEIAGFSSDYFYEGKLQAHNPSIEESLIYYDTAGAGFDEKREENSRSVSNPEELRIIAQHCGKWINEHENVVFISPYSSQVELAKTMLPKSIKISTIDSFQGQEADVVLLSLVRSNAEGKIGFLSDYRRMNVALTRAKTKLVVIGDSTTLAGDDFYQRFLNYTEQIGAYRSVFELMY